MNVCLTPSETLFLGGLGKGDTVSVTVAVV